MKVEITYFDKPLELELKLSWYRTNKRIAIAATEVGECEPFGMVTVNAVDTALAADEAVVKTFDENERWVPQLLTLLPEVFQDTGRRVQLGFATYDIWKIKAAAFE